MYRYSFCSAVIEAVLVYSFLFSEELKLYICITFVQLKLRLCT